MPTNTLTDTACRSAKPGEKPRKLFDGHGMFLFVSPTGAKVWRMSYRLDGKPQTATFGPYPQVTLAEARAKRDELRKQLLLGENPKASKAAPAVPTFQAASDTYWDGRLDITDAYRMNAKNGITQHLGPHIGPVPVSQVSKDALLNALLEMDKAGLLVYVRSVRGWASQVFDWAIERGYRQDNPAALIKPAKAFRVPARESHAAITPAQVHTLMERLKFEDQLQSVTYNVQYIGIDATGGWGQAVHELVVKFCPGAKALRYDLDLKPRMVLKAQSVINKGRLEFDTSWVDMAHSFMAIKKTLTASQRHVTYHRRPQRGNRARRPRLGLHACIRQRAA